MFLELQELLLLRLLEEQEQSIGKQIQLRQQPLQPQMLKVIFVIQQEEYLQLIYQQELLEL